MSERLEKWLTDANWRDGYYSGIEDARREPTYGRRFYMLGSDSFRARKGPSYCAGYQIGYDEQRPDAL